MYKDGAESKGCSVSSQRLASVFSSMTGAVLNVSAGKVLAAQGDEVRGIFRIVRGYIRLCVYTKEGTRRIVAFYGPGAILGIDQLNSPRWKVAVEALTQ